MQNVEVKDTIQKIKKTKPKTKEEFEELITNGKRNENTGNEERVNSSTTNEEDAVKVVQRSCAQRICTEELEEIIENKKASKFKQIIKFCLHLTAFFQHGFVLYKNLIVHFLISQSIKKILSKYEYLTGEEILPNYYLIKRK